MKKFTVILSIILCLSLVATLLAACAPKDIKAWESNEINDDGTPYNKV